MTKTLIGIFPPPPWSLPKGSLSVITFSLPWPFPIALGKVKFVQFASTLNVMTCVCALERVKILSSSKYEVETKKKKRNRKKKRNCVNECLSFNFRLQILITSSVRAIVLQVLKGRENYTRGFWIITRCICHDRSITFTALPWCLTPFQR